MTGRSLSLWLLSFWLSPAFAGMNWDTQCMAGINTALAEVVFEPISEEYYPNMCRNELIVNSWWAAAKLYCTPKEIEAGQKMYAGYCTEYGDVELITYAETLPILTDEYIAALNVVTYDSRDPLVVWDTPVLIDYDLYLAGYKTTVRITQIGALCREQSHSDR